MKGLAQRDVARSVQVEGHAPKHDFSFSSHLRPPTDRAHYWFAVMMDCYLEEYDAHPPPMIYSLTLLNGNSHLPEGVAEMLSPSQSPCSTPDPVADLA
jgi:hypothetical protein